MLRIDVRTIALARLIQRTSYETLVYAVLALPLAAFVLALVTCVISPDWPPVWLLSPFQWGGPFLRSAVAGCLSECVVALVSILLSTLALRSILLGETRFIAAFCGLSTLAITPLLLGIVPFSFLWSQPIRELGSLLLPADAARAGGTVILVEVVGQAMRYIPLLTWLLSIIVLNLPAEKKLYLRQLGVRSADVVRGDLIPQWLPFILIVLAFAYQDAANDYQLSYFALRPSPATETELYSHFLSRTFLSVLTSRNANVAIGFLIVSSSIAALLFAMLFCSTAMFVLWIGRLLHPSEQQLANLWPRQSTSNERGLISHYHGSLGQVGASGCLIVALIASITGLPSAALSSLRSLSMTFALAAVVSAVAWAIAVFITFSLRADGDVADGTAQRKLSTAALVAVFAGFVPPSGFAGAIYWLCFTVLDNSQMASLIGWTVAQIVRLMPILVIFTIPMALAIEDQSIRYLELIGARFAARLFHLCLRPFAASHFAFILIGWNLVLNESVIGTVFQADIPSLPEMAIRAMSGRSAAYPVVGLLVMLISGIFGILLLVWGLSVFFGWRRRDDKY
jgi:hypothetical protein